MALPAFGWARHCSNGSPNDAAFTLSQLLRRKEGGKLSNEKRAPGWLGYIHPPPENWEFSHFFHRKYIFIYDGFVMNHVSFRGGGVIGDEILPIYLGIIINYDKDI